MISDKLYNVKSTKMLCTPGDAIFEDELIEVVNPDELLHSRSIGLTLTRVLLLVRCRRSTRFAEYVGRIGIVSLCPFQL